MSNTYKPYNKLRQPRLSTEQLIVMGQGYLDKKGQQPTDDEILGAVRSFDYWREFEGTDGHHRPMGRKRAYGRNADRFDRFLTWVLFWEKKGYVPADAKPVKFKFKQAGLFEED